ncbi:MAG TPA: VOC family protein [Candidatus Cybelea sp.]|nr:VOC family protein [Candidatus Cybelea sp.]
MAFENALIDHVQLTVPMEREAEALVFYRTALGLKEIPKPPELQKNGGAWFQLGTVQLHIAREPIGTEANSASKRHACFVVAELSAAEQRLRQRGVEIVPDQQPTEGWIRFYVRDPGGNRLEIAQRA